MGWAEVQNAVKQAISKALDRAEDDPCVEWENRANRASLLDPYSDQGLAVDLRLGAVVQKGRGEKRRIFDTEANAYKTSYSGYRLFTVTCFLTTFSQEPGEDAQSFAGKLRTLIRRDDVHEILSKAKVALVTVGQNFNVDFQNAESRMQSATVVEFRFSTTEEYIDQEANLGWIETAEGDGEFETGVDGNPVESHFDTKDQ